MNLEERIRSFSVLGEILRNALGDNSEEFATEINYVIDNQYLTNPWFTPDNVRAALNAVASELTEENLIKWTGAYPLLKEEIKPVRAGVIMAGNIPLVGFHDFLTVLISGNHLIAKTSSKDSGLIFCISRILCFVNPEFINYIEFADGNLSGFDLVIATGSNNSSRYFEYYFGKYPSIIRKNRNSIAIIDGSETESELEALGADVFLYFGLGCRNVSKLYIPEEYNLRALSENWGSFSGCINHRKYANNYDFNKAVYLVNKEYFYDTGYILMKEESKLSSPVSVLHFEYYKSYNAVKQETEVLNNKIQCIIGKDDIPYGKAHTPHLWDYADGIDTLDFLLKNKIAGIL
jgi:hypothetical protein